jgi:hypothetical protein
MTIRTLLVAALVAAIVPVQLIAQDTTKPKPDSTQGGTMDDHHMMGPWKEMNAFHRIMAATWHPASQKGDVAPLKARVKELLSTADAWAASQPPAMPASCGNEAVRNAAIKVASESKALVALVDSGADDARLKTALKGVHEAFEVAEKGCGGHG